MGSEIPSDLTNTVANLENQAFQLLRRGDYASAEKIYRLIDEILRKRQLSEKKRIHKGSPLHMIGFALLLQRKLEESLKFFMLAHIEDALSTPLGKEEEADSAPAGQVLRKAFQVNSESLQTIKKISLAKKQLEAPVFDPGTILDEFLSSKEVDQILSLCQVSPDAERIQRQLLVYLTPRAKKQ